MNNHTEIEEIKKSLEGGKNLFVLMPQNPSIDVAGSALALALSLKETGKQVTVGCQTKMRVEYSRLVGVNEISEKIGNRNLVVTFPPDTIEKVTYNEEGGKFNLVIQPKPGHPPLDIKNLEVAYEGIEADVIIVIGATRLEDLGMLYEKERESFSSSTVVNLDRSPANTTFGQINLVNSQSASVSEIVFRVLKDCNLPMNVDIAGNLLRGIEAQTQNFQSPFASPDTFETVAQLMRAGAKRSPAPLTSRQWVPPGINLGSFAPKTTPFPSATTPWPTLPPDQPPSFQEPKLEVARPVQEEEHPGTSKGSGQKAPQGEPKDNIMQAPPVDWYSAPPILKGSTKV